ncbi:hypothetical protein PANT_18c00101 [Moesziomyces antarcticus T-34]|uniref:Zn(2)-C6 fungal-type domain-containing protein n=1 Tax=Pseudozyma antarctica (strain T-34) TaxID=1151754 RepID=M9MF46_PSEA3|nr:hypothetical protein PANT_18c00101 [Moesziomyces antarcticus T-34]
MSRAADVACVECRRRKVACSKRLPHCTECLVHARECCYSRDKRRRIDDDAQAQLHLHPVSSSSGVNLQSKSISSSGTQVPLSSSTIPADPLCGTIPDAINDTFWWLASEWQSSSTCDSLSDWPEWTNTFNQTDSTRQSIPNNATNASIDADSLRLTKGCNGGAHAQDAAAPFPAQGRSEASAELHPAYKRCLPEPSRWPTLLKALERLCRTAHGPSEAETSPFLCLSKLQEQLELDTVLAQDGLASIISQPGLSSSSVQPDPLRCAWTLAAICLAESILASSPIELPRNLTLEELGHKPDATVLLFTVAWEHCRKGLCGDPIQVMQTYRMMSLAFSRCHQGQELASASVFLGCRAAATMSIHRAATIAHLGSTLRQQQALNAFWHLVSQGCHFQAWQGRDMPIDLALVELPMPDPKASMQQQADPLSSWHTAAATESPRSQFLSSSPVFVARIWTSIAVGQTIERHYRQGASLLVPCEARLEVATPMTTKPSHQEEDHVERTGKALDFCASLLQTREPASADHKESQLKRFVLMLMRYTRVLLHYPFCRVDRDHRKAAQESISATVSTVLGTLLSLGAKDDDDQEEDEEDEEEEEEGGDNDLNGANYHRRQLRGRCQNGSTRSDAPSSLTQPDLARSARVDRHLLELLAGLSLRALVFTLALIKHPLLPLASDSASSADDGERQRSDALLALGALEQLHQLGVVSAPLLRKARKAARLGGGI